MKLLVITQKIDKNDPVLGFFHRWVAELSGRFEKITAVCLEKGELRLPENVETLSLGKESGRSKWKYVRNFYRYVWAKRNEYDAVFVHMNQEYILLGGIFWKLFGKRIYMWRNHHAGGEFTDIASWFCAKVFCTSRFSYTAKYRKTVLMPVGVDTGFFRKDASAQKNPRSVLFLGRIAPVKKPDLLIRALGDLARKGVDFSATIVGDPLPRDRKYADLLRDIAHEEGVGERVSFAPGIPNEQTRATYNAHAVFVNLSTSGMYDKTIFEAMACETLVLASNENLRGLIADDFIFKENDRAELASKLEKLLDSSGNTDGEKLRATVTEHHSLSKLTDRLFHEMK